MVVASRLQADERPDAIAPEAAGGLAKVVTGVGIVKTDALQSIPADRLEGPRAPLVRQGRWGNVLAPPPLAESLWTGAGPGKHGLRTASAVENREQQNMEFPGGMRNPTRAVAKLPRLRGLGKHLTDEFDTFALTHDEVWNLAERFGTEDYEGPSSDLVAAWEL
eukprot:619393-Heterocapsa_arctica.AAC.1